jgi:two-component system sensor histidine kinase KdpD
MTRGRLRVYLGAAPGVGKTFAMLNEGNRRRQRGTDVVVGLVATHRRPTTAAQLGGLEVVPPRRVGGAGGTDGEMDTDAVIARRPEVALVDEIAHTNAPGSRFSKRWQEVELLLDAGIDVITTVNVEHLESLNDVVSRIAGVVQADTVPDGVIRAADQVELVDMSSEALRRRMAHGNIYPAEAVDAALANQFRVANLVALRELALLWVADRVEDSLQHLMASNRTAPRWETRERVVVTLTGAPGSDHLIRRAARMAGRSGGDLVGVHVPVDRPAGGAASLDRHRRLLEELGGTYHEVAGADVAEALVAFAAGQRATQLVLGTSRRSRWTEMTQGSVINKVIRNADRIDVHVISTDGAGGGPERTLSSVRNTPLRRRDRRVAGYAAALALIPALTFLFSEDSALMHHDARALSSGAGFLIYLGAVAVVALMVGVLPGLLVAAAGAAAVDYYLIRPYGSFALARGVDAAYLALFLFAAGAVCVAAEQAARRRVQALHASDDADMLIALADRLTRRNPPEAAVAEVRSALNRKAVTLMARQGDGWRVEASAGDPVARSPEDGEHYDLRAGHVVVMNGPTLQADEHRRVAGVLAYLEAVLAISRLETRASAVDELSQANDLRTALLAAVSHDLRTPLASIKALATGLLETDVEWSKEETREFLTSIDVETDRLNHLVDNLLDMSRLQAGALHLSIRPIGLDEVVPAAVGTLSQERGNIVVDVSETLPRVNVDPALLERAVANIIDNALRHSRPAVPVRVGAGHVAGRVDLRVVDSGTGIPIADRDRLFQPFQRLGDTGNGNGIGLGLAVSHGFIEAMGGQLTVEDTPGGGITMVMSLPTARDAGRLSAGPVESALPVRRTASSAAGPILSSASNTNRGSG